jgi:hypothetical protein
VGSRDDLLQAPEFIEPDRGSLFLLSQDSHSPLVIFRENFQIAVRASVIEVDDGNSMARLDPADP